VSFSTVVAADLNATVLAAYNTANTTTIADTTLLAAAINANVAAIAPRYVTQTADDTVGLDIVGAASLTTSDNVINGGADNDVIVLGTTVGVGAGSDVDDSNDTVVFSGSFGNDVIVNFVVGADAFTGRDVLDFKALGGDITTQADLTTLVVTNKSVFVTAVVADAGVVGTAEVGETFNAAAIKLTLDASVVEDATASTHVFVTYVAATNIGTVYTVADGTAADDSVVTLVGTIDLADTAWAGLTIANFA